MKVKDRIKELRRVPAKDLIPNEANWRTHPDNQKNALRGILAEVGIADAVIAYETPEGLKLIDGHLRAETLDQEIPVLVLDVTDDEANKLLLTLDPLAGMAGSSKEQLESLLGEVQTQNDALQQLFDLTAGQAGLEIADGTTPPGEDENPYTHKVEIPHYEASAEKPLLAQCFDDSKTKQLIDDINASGVSEDEKHFLREAAHRHTVFHFQKLANYYAHSEAPTQRLMEDSALVIVDIDRAIKNGWARLTGRLDELYSEEKENVEE